MNIKYEIKRIDSISTKIAVIENLNDVLRFVKSNINPHVNYKITMIESSRKDVTEDIHRIILGR